MVLSCSEADTRNLGASLGALLEGGETLALVGDLGSGKTAFARGVGRGLGITDPSLVSSPTYVLEQVYPARVPIHHYDAYRLSSEVEFLDLGFDEQLKGRNVLIVEWAEKVAGALPEETLWVEFLPGGGDDRDARRIRIFGPASVWNSKLDLKFPPSSVDR